MNSFRKSVMTGKLRDSGELVISEKRPSGVQGLDELPVVRDAIRSADHRDDDRHRLTAETAIARYRGADHPVDLINLSGGGAMIRGDFTPRLWDTIELMLGDEASVECAVRWIRGDRLGLEFAHETRVQASPMARDTMLLEVIRRSYPHLVDLPAAPTSDEEPLAVEPREGYDSSRRGEGRHPLIWSGEIHHSHDSYPVRLRNISSSGALVESQTPFPVGVELYLDLGAAGSLFATVSWALGDQVGLRFAMPYDITQLANAKPDLAPHRWSTPTYLREDQADSSPWAKQWGRLSVDELRVTLEGYLKR